jgi:transcriptional regulator with XRE-family HTH domain
MAESGEDSQHLGALMREKREKKLWSQEKLAVAMTNCGHDWYQSTVHKVESGQRTISWDEAVAVAQVLKFHLSEAAPMAFDLLDAEKLYEQAEITLQAEMEALHEQEEAVERAKHDYRLWGEKVKELRDARGGPPTWPFTAREEED